MYEFVAFSNFIGSMQKGPLWHGLSPLNNLESQYIPKVHNKDFFFKNAQNVKHVYHVH